MKFTLYVAPWCATCHAVAPTIQKLVEGAGHQFTIQDLEQEMDQTALTITNLPSLVAFGPEGEELGRLSGQQTPDVYRSFIRSTT